MSFNGLSDDIILEIAEWVGTDSYLFLGMYGYGPTFVEGRGTKFLSTLVLCSRRLHTIASPVLYRTFTSTGSEGAALPAFLHLVLRKPEIGKEVKKIVASGVHDEDEVDMSAFSNEDFEGLQHLIDSFGDLRIDKYVWMTDIKEGLQEAVWCILLFFLPLLEEIDLVSYNDMDSKYMDAIFHFIAQNQRHEPSLFSLRHLKTISAAYSDTEMGMSTSAIMPFCRPRSVSKVKAHMVAESDAPGPESNFYSQYQVQDLELSYSCINGDTLILFLRCFPSLRKFHYDHGGAIVGDSDFLPQYFGRALAHLHPCLETLMLLNDEADVFGEERPQAIGSLREFEKLREMWCQATTLFGPDDDGSEDPEEDDLNGPAKPQLVDILPASLKILRILRCNSDIVEHLREVLIQREEKFPALTEISVVFRQPEPDTEDSTASSDVDLTLEKELEDEYQGKGVKLRIVHPAAPKRYSPTRGWH